MRAGGGETTVTTTYTNDVSGFSSSQEEANRAKQELAEKYKLKDLGLDFTLGIKIDHDENAGTISLSQHTYAERILQKYGMQDCAPKSTPLPVGVTYTASSSPLSNTDRYFMRDKPYNSAIGLIMYLMIVTRPDLAFAVNILSAFASNPGPPHWRALQHVMAYIKGTLNYRVTCKQGTSLKPYGYVDADFAGFVDTPQTHLDWTSKGLLGPFFCMAK